jgi:hypothetical protein
LYENRIVKPVEIVLSRGADGMRENNGKSESHQDIQ